MPYKPIVSKLFVTEEEFKDIDYNFQKIKEKVYQTEEFWFQYHRKEGDKPGHLQKLLDKRDKCLFTRDCLRHALKVDYDKVIETHFLLQFYREKIELLSGQILDEARGKRKNSYPDLLQEMIKEENQRIKEKVRKYWAQWDWDITYS